MSGGLLRHAKRRMKCNGVAGPPSKALFPRESLSSYFYITNLLRKSREGLERANQVADFAHVDSQRNQLYALFILHATRVIISAEELGTVSKNNLRRNDDFLFTLHTLLVIHII